VGTYTSDFMSVEGAVFLRVVGTRSAEKKAFLRFWLRSHLINAHSGVDEREPDARKCGKGGSLGLPASLFVGQSPTAGILPPHASRQAQISGRAICVPL